MKRKTHEEYVNELFIKNPTIEAIGKYCGANTKIMHHCVMHNIYWDTTPSIVLQGAGCKICKKEKFYKIRSKSHQQYIKEVTKINPNIEVVEKYSGARIPIKHYCKKHNIFWNTTPGNVLKGCGCTECGKEKLSKKLHKSHEQYIEELGKINPNITAIEKYIDANTKILHKCLIDGYEWHAIPARILYGAGCPKCTGTIKRTHEEYVCEVAEINPDIEVIGKYSNTTTPILHKCLIDGHEWNVAPYSILHGTGCPRCCESSGERKIRQWLEKHNIKYIYQKVFKDCRDIKPLPFDFYLPNNFICIEYDGGQHTKPIEHFGGAKVFERTIKHDKMKDEYCKNNGISLLRIPYFKNVEEELNNFLFI